MKKLLVVLLFLLVSGAYIFAQMPGTPYMPCPGVVIPSTITLSQNRIYLMASVYDTDYLPYTAPVGAATTGSAVADGATETVTLNVQGTITTTGITVAIPVTATGSNTLPAYSTTINIPASLTEDGVSRDLTLTWASQAYTSATKSITATIAAVGATLNVKKLDINAGIGNDYLGVLLGTFTYPYDNAGNTTTYQVRDIPGIPDKMFGLADNTGNATTHLMLYVPVQGEDGNIWLNNNLGADYTNMNKASFNPGGQATAFNDFHAYGSFFQWGRKPDGHELITWTGSTVGTPVNGTTSTKSDVPANALFITAYDWRVTQNDALWATEASTNNPCPNWFRVPTNAELTALFTAAGITNYTNAASSVLKFSATAVRSSTGALGISGSHGYYWSSSVSGISVSSRYFDSGSTYTFSGDRNYGMTVRCIMNTPAMVAALDCAGAINNGMLTQGIAASGVSSVISYIGGNGGDYKTQTVSSTGVTGLTATLTTGTVASGAGTLTYIITGTPVGNGTASFAVNIGGQSCTFTRTVAIVIPSTITLAQDQKYFVASVYDRDFLPYSAPTSAATLAVPLAVDGITESVTLNVQGTITTTGVTVNIPATATGNGTLPAYSTTINIPASFTEDGITRDLSFTWASQAYTSATKSIVATIKAVGGTLNVKKLDVNSGIGNDYLGFLLGTFTYSYNNAGNTTTFQVRDIAPIPDKMFGLADNTGSTTTHQMLYLPVRGEDGNIWLNNNLGADYANLNKASFNPAGQATDFNDYHAYGSLFQWGRKPDGHELVNWTSSTAGTPVNGTTGTISDAPANALFIVQSEWRVTQDLGLWVTEASTNNPCPRGFRVPPINQFVIMLMSAGITGSENAASSKLKFSGAGLRFGSGASGGNGRYWSSSAEIDAISIPDPPDPPIYAQEANNVHFFSGGVSYPVLLIGYGLAVRCMKY